MENIFVEFLPPWIETGLQPAFYDKESGTVLQQTARMYARVNMLIRMFNKLSKNTKTLVEDYIEQFNELHDYVHDYFDNLDVQEEINNKLDAMVEDGTFAEVLTPLISSYEQELLDFKKLMDWDSIVYTKYRDEAAECDYYITEIPLQNEYGGNNIIRVGLANGDTTISGVEKPTDFAYRNKSPFVTNAGIFYSNAEHPTAYGLVIKDGVILKNENISPGYYDDIIAIKEDGSMKSYPVGTNPQTIINDGYVDAIVGYYVLIENGEVADTSDYRDSGVNPRQIVCRKTNGDYLFLTCDGRTPINKGLDLSDCIQILSNYDIDFAFVLDGGGSTGTVVRGEKINRNIDNYGEDERAVATMLYLDSEASPLFFEAGEVYNNQKIDEAKTSLKDKKLPYVETYFYGNLFDKNNKNIQTNKEINPSTGEVVDRENTLGPAYDTMVSDYIQLAPTYTYKIHNTGDYHRVYFYDENKEFLWSDDIQATNDTFRPNFLAAYVRVVVRRYAMNSYGIYLESNYEDGEYTPFREFRYDTLFEDLNGSRTVTIGNILDYKKILIYVIDDSAQQQCREILVRPNYTNIFTSFIRMQASDTSVFSLRTSRITINQTTGEITIDRDYSVSITGNPNVSISETGEASLIKIMKVEAYY